MDSKVTSWREWEISAEWASSNECPDCGNTLIITHLVSPAISDTWNDEQGSDLHNGICPKCRKQYSVLTDAGTLTPNLQASQQQDRIDQLEARVERLEALVQNLMKRQTVPTHPPIPEEPKDDADDFRKKYRFLF